MIRKYGWRPQTPDFRDLSYGIIAPAEIKIPQVKYLIYPPVQDQGDEGSCVFNAATSAMEYCEIDQAREKMMMFSRQFAYYHYRETYGEVLQDNGAVIRDALKLLTRDGVCLEKIWPYDEAKFAWKPRAEAYENAKGHKIESYYAIDCPDTTDGLWNMLTCLAEGFPFICGISVYSSLETDEVARTGNIPFPNRDEKFLGGHCVYIGGYDQHKKVFHGQNSWGEGWGNKGRFTIPFAYLTHPGLAADFWTIRR